jgi:Tfp pilus assembly protein PilN
MQSINLIPQQEVVEQSKDRAVKVSTWFSIFILLLVGGIAGYYVYRTQEIKQQLSVVNTEIDGLRQQISTLADVEVSARNLDKKYSTLKEIFASRILYSMLSKEIQARTPQGVVIESITLQKGTQINISGSADNYISIANFTNNLVDSEFSGGEPTLKTLFSTVTLNSVSLEKSRNVVTFSINVSINSNLLQKR